MPSRPPSFDVFSAAYKMRTAILIDGKRYPVASIEVSLLHNQIPRIVAVIAPTEIPLGTSGATIPMTDAEEATVAHLTEFVRDIQTKVATGSVPVRLKMDAVADNDKQEFDVKDWELGAIGLTDLASAGALGVMVEIYHPIYKLMSCPSLMFNDTASANGHNKTEGDNPLELFTNSVKNQVDKIGATFPDLADIQTAMKDQLTQFNDEFSDHIEWDKGDSAGGGDDLPFNTDYPEVTAALRLVVGKHGRRPDASMWDVFSRAFCGDFDLAFTGGLKSEKLILSPFTPWGKTQVTLYDDELDQLTYPVRGKHGLVAVMGLGKVMREVDNYGQADSARATTDNSASVEDIEVAGGYYEPVKKGLIGHVRTLHPPEWIQSYPVITSSANPPDSSSIFEGESSESSGPSSVDTGSPDIHKGSIEKWCKQRFFSLYRAEMGLSWSGRLMLQNDSKYDTPGKELIPGISVEIKSRAREESDDEAERAEATLLRAYLVEVRHVIDCDSGVCYTAIRMAYPRTDKEIPAEDAFVSAAEIEAGVKNALYNVDGQIGV